ncbi:hypothetical protein [Propionivibrio sp.]|uniref:hypothetical protein n=1 Tax=Propionivibrio sp. TaxID=2212460 RepID=UPI00260D43B1|nr:hypothetical protein [Propionivibrio sp.]
MTIKQLAFDAQQHLHANTGANFKRAHIYELLAAALGFSSYASLTAGHVFTQNGLTSRHPASFAERVGRRCLDLDYPPEAALRVSQALPIYMTQKGIGVVRISDLLANLLGETGDSSYGGGDSEGDDNERLESWLDVESITCPILLEGLVAAGDRGDARAHYALALLHAPTDDDPYDEPVGSEFWYTEEKNGRVLAGVEKEWADAYAASLSNAEKYEHHLRTAGALGHEGALLEMAERFDDPSFFERPPHPSADIDPSLAADLAERLGRPDDAWQWLTIAAERGDTEAMRKLIEGYDQSTPQRCWQWFYLAEMLGTDLAKDEYRAINEDGSDYDDDIGGPAYVGGRGGVELELIDAASKAAAKSAASTFFDAIKVRGDALRRSSSI